MQCSAVPLGVRLSLIPGRFLCWRSFGGGLLANDQASIDTAPPSTLEEEEVVRGIRGLCPSKLLLLLEPTHHRVNLDDNSQRSMSKLSHGKMGTIVGSSGL